MAETKIASPDSMIERIARAIGEHCDGYADPVDAPQNWARAIGAARAALIVMREPSDAMTVACAAIELASTRADMMVEGCEEIWQRMIDAALAKEVDI